MLCKSQGRDVFAHMKSWATAVCLPISLGSELFGLKKP